MKGYLNTQQVSELVGLSVSRLNVMRLDKYSKDANGNRKSTFIPFYKIGSKVFYKKSDIEEFMSKSRIS